MAERTRNIPLSRGLIAPLLSRLLAKAHNSSAICNNYRFREKARESGVRIKNGLLFLPWQQLPGRVDDRMELVLA
jgi:hypothetical protein